MEKEERKEAMSKVLRFFGGLFLWFILTMGWAFVLENVLRLRRFKSGISEILFGGLLLVGMIGFGYLVWLFFTKAKEIRQDYYCAKCGEHLWRPVADRALLLSRIYGIVKDHDLSEKILHAVMYQLKKHKIEVSEDER